MYDETQEVARAFTAACTPDFFLFGPDHRLVYRGQFDDARPSNDVPVTGESLRAAVDSVLGGNDVDDRSDPIDGLLDQVAFGDTRASRSVEAVRLVGSRQ